MKFKILSAGIAVISSLTVLSGEALAEKVYWEPTIDGLEVDRCITSHQYPDGCSKAATTHTANMFCQHYGYSHASSARWEDQPMEQRRSVYKLLEESSSSFFGVRQGSYVFTGISCVGWT